MNYNIYATSAKSSGKCLYQLTKLGIPSHIVSSLLVNNNNNTIICNGELFANYKYDEFDTPIFKFSHSYANFNQIKQLPFVILFGLNSRGDYEEVGMFTDFNGFAFKELLSKYPKVYLANFDGVPLREQILNPTTIEDKLNRLKNKFSK